MAGSSYRDDADDAPITDINVTPFVDIVLVLLVVFMVTAKLIVARGVDLDKPKAVTGGELQSSLRVSVKVDGRLFVNGDEFTSDDAAIARIKELAATTSRPKAVITGDRKSAYGGVMRAIDLVKRADGDIGIALENELP